MLNKSFEVIISNKIKPFKKTINIDADKSISIRSFIIGSISHNISKIDNALESDDVHSTINCLEKLGTKIIKKNRQYLIYGKGLGSLIAKKNTVLNVGNSGTCARLITGLCSTSPNIQIKIKGDDSLNKRNMSKLIKLMGKFGATFYPKNKVKFPLTLVSSDMPIGINYIAGSSAQLKSAVILAALNSNGVTNITEEKESRNPTENMLLQNPNVIKISRNSKKQNYIKVFGKNYLNPLRISVPGDPSSAAFFTALTLFTPNSFLKMKNVGLNKRRIGFYHLLKKHGAKIQFINVKKISGETVGDIIVRSSSLKPISASEKYYPSTTDEYVILFICAALIKGVSKFKGIADLSNKESSRALEVKKILSQIGIRCKLSKDVMKIYGTQKIENIKKIINVPKLGDHRIAMGTFILSLITGIKSNIKNFETVRTSSPSFLNIVSSLGAKYEIKKK